MGDETIEVLVGRLRNIQIPLTNIVNCFIVNHELPSAAIVRERETEQSAFSRVA